MNNSKKLVSLLLVLMMVFLVACGQKTTDTTGTDTSAETTAENTSTEDTTEEAGAGETANPVDLKLSSTTELTLAGTNSLASLDYVVSSKSGDHSWNANFVETLLEFNRVGKLVGSLAESWSHSEDGLTWTFKLRPDVKWVTHTGEEFDTVKADDFVTGLRHAAEFDSETLEIVLDIIDGLAEYADSDKSDEAWAKVGVKAVDDLTLEYKLVQPTPFFGDIATYSTLMPINRSFLESKGAGCLLGAPNPEDCTFGQPTPDSILYNGAFVLESVTEKSSIVMVKNPAFWGADSVKLEKFTEIYDDGSDPYSIKRGFENGTYPSMGLRPTWSDYEAIRGAYADYVRESLPNSVVFGVLMNYNRQKFEHTNYATDETLRNNTRTALLNENFRKALRAAYDVKSMMMVSAPEKLAQSTMRNINNFNEAGFHSDGRGYHALVNDTYNANTGETRDLSDGNAPFLSKDEALAYIEAAKAEGVQFPVHLDYLVIETSDALVKRANSVKKSVEDNTDGQIIIELVLRPEDTVYALTYYNEDPEEADFDISTFAGWGPDYNDPLTFAKTFSPDKGHYMTSLGLGKGKDSNADLKDQLGFTEYQKLLDEASAILDDKDARLEAFAKVDSLLLEKALFIPTTMQTRSELVSFAKPFQMAYSQVGISEYKYKNFEFSDHLVTKAEYEELKAAWEKEVSEAAGN